MEMQAEYASHPGRVLANLIKAKGISREEFCRLSGIGERMLGNLINGTKPVYLPDQTLLGLEGATGVSRDFWRNLFEQYRNSLANRKLHGRN